MKDILLNNNDIYLFNIGEAQKAYLLFGCHYDREHKAYRFCVWAPCAQSVSVVGDFNDWDERQNPMKQISGGVWVAYIKGLKDGDLYKYSILGYGDSGRFLKSDPFAFYSEVRPGTASKVWNMGGFEWSDGAYLQKRQKRDVFSSPMSIYELHIGSWMKREDGSFLNYREVADLLLEYVKKMGYTHVEIMPVMEYPLDMSWGYQITGYYSINSRYGTPQDFMYFVDHLHSGGIGVILDWVPAHFPRDSHGLRKFDGTSLYEHENPLQGEQPQWGTMLYNYERAEVQSFLVSNAVYFMEEYHIDGLRVDAVSAMLYLDYGKDEYIPNKDGGNLNLGAIDFLRKLNSVVLTCYKGTMMIAEESTAYPLVTMPPADGGLGFTYKWNMGFMHDTLEYMEMDPVYRKGSHDKLTFSMFYAFTENFILPYSHDEVVHGKRSMIDKMFGNYEDKFASLKTLYSFQYAHPGKKLMFMGDEFGQFIEWDYAKQLDWFLLEYDSHRTLQQYVAALNRLYKNSRALYQIDDRWEGFEWLNVEDKDTSTIAFMRRSKKWRGKRKYIVFAANFTPVARDLYPIALPCEGVLKELLNSDHVKFGGRGFVNPEPLMAKEEPWGGKPFSARVNMPALGGVFFEFTPKEQ